MVFGSVQPRFCDLNFRRIGLAALHLSSFSFGLHGHSPFPAFTWSHSLAWVGLHEFGFAVPFVARDLVMHRDAMGGAAACGAEVLVRKVSVAHMRR